ncbi:MAG: GntR family transcriptional regulator [Sedimentisphaerales bacterium]|jgi:GntR family transcriptional regulator|nr:GntR family transcriptional regulator [Sedimentisphaerales bacterium]NLZ04225.1 GntR family transcriptional regulator [Phycisphaerae bacterium]HNY79842.1 GntR family transcriptional regulator [Sedimentisphaerales bacterium]HOC64844.1 GntR family transcriptional regulator [Sedimentisphaerales bacterium]HOH65774.1 GntR family transcriptional regulator [Sedimentisphaerales bacterium]
MIEFKLDLKSGVPFHRQIVDQIRYGIASGRLLPGEQLPTVRDLAVQLQVNPNTVRKAYSELEILGILDTQQGTGTFVSHREVEIGDAEKRRMLKQICDELVARGHQYNLTLTEIVEYLQGRPDHETQK